MTLYRMFDAAYPPVQPYPGCAAVAGYIGGNTPHVWTAAEWDRFAHLRQLPIWTGYGDPRPAAEQARAAVDAMLALGWKADLPPGTLEHRRVVVLDEETSTDATFVGTFGAVMHLNGFGCWPYGSESTLFALPVLDGRWMALYDSTARLENHARRVVAHQYAAGVPWEGGQVDLSVISGQGLAHLGRGPRRPA
jgi:hypothetical protein